MEKIILDVDTGHDDAVAIVLAAGSPSIDIQGLCCVGGNTWRSNVINNTLNLCESFGIKAPVLSGAEKPLVNELHPSAHIHGVSGFDGPVFPPRKWKELTPGHAASFMVDSVNANPGEISIVATGPLTDVALAIRLDSDFAKNVKRIVFMGGSFSVGNASVASEFNILTDPEAANIVLTSGALLYMFPLDVTLKILLDNERLQKFRELKLKASEIYCKSMEHYSASCMKVNYDWPAMHDPCTVAFLAEPQLFTITEKHVEVDINHGICYGRTVEGRNCDSEKNVRVATDVDVEGFWNLLKNSMTNLG